MIDNKLNAKELGKLLLILLVVNLAACSTQTNSRAERTTSQGILAGGTVGAALGTTAAPAGVPLGAALGGLTGGLIANYNAKQVALVQVLADKQVRIVEVGEQIRLIIPATQLFSPQSVAMRSESYSLLNEIAMLLRTYPKTTVTLIGYTDNLGDSQRNIALSRQRAQAVADYLWSQDIDARLFYTEGRGEEQPLANNSTPQGRLWNERIEISFQRLASA